MMMVRHSRPWPEGSIRPEDVDCDEETLRTWFHDESPAPAMEVPPDLWHGAGGLGVVSKDIELGFLVDYLASWRHGPGGCLPRFSFVPSFEGGFCPVCSGGIFRSVLGS